MPFHGTPDAALPTASGGGAVHVNLLRTFLLAANRQYSGSLTRATFLSARNDVDGNLAIIAAGFKTIIVSHSAWPGLFLGIPIAIINADAARDV